MTRDEILTVPAGPRMDAWIVNTFHIDGVLVEEQYGQMVPKWKHFDGFRMSFEPSQDIEAAWEVVEKLQTMRYNLHLEMFDCSYWRANFCGPEHPPKWNHRRNAEAIAAPLAICRAALLTTLEE